jgi:hypothetical protein
MYRVLIVDSRYQSKGAAVAPHFSDFLKNQVTATEVLIEEEAKAAAAYVDGTTIWQAIQQAGQIP